MRWRPEALEKTVVPKRTARAHMLAAWARIASGPSVLYEWKHVRLEPHPLPAPAPFAWCLLGREHLVQAFGARPVRLAGSPTERPGLRPGMCGGARIAPAPCGGARLVPRAVARRGVRSPGA